MARAKYWIWLFCFCSFGSLIISFNISFTGSSKYILSNKAFTLSCSSSRKPRGEVAIFIKDGKKAIILRRTTTECYGIPQNPVENAFICDSSCNCSLDAKRYIWTYNGLISSKTVTFKCMMDSGTDFRNDTFKTLTVELAYGPTNVSLTRNQSMITVNESDTLGPIYCSADCVPNCTYTWRGPGLTKDISVLEIENIQRNHNGTYNCTAENTHGSKEVQIYVIVQYGPGLVDINPSQPDYIVKENDNVGPITCTSLCVPQCSHIWTGQGIIPTVNQLHLTDIQRSNSGQFTCTARNIVSSNQTQISITVEYGPTSVSLTPYQSMITVNESDTLGPIYCSADCMPNCTYTWRGPGFTEDISVLEIKKIQRIRNGTFKCTATNTHGDRDVDIRIVVQFGPASIELSPSTESYTVEEDKNVGPIDCTSICYPPCLHEWKGPGMAPTANSINLLPIKRNNAGNFTCTAYNIVSSLQRKIRIIVQYGPSSVSLQPSQSIVTVNESNHVGPIHCTADCVPNCTYIWSGAGITNEMSTLELTDIQRNSSGNYTCTAKNSYGSTADVILIIVQYGPSKVLLMPSSHIYTVKENYSLDNIICSASCLPRCQLNWAGPALSTNSENLNLTNIHRHQSGNYTCTAFNSLSSAKKQITVTVLYAAKVLLLNISREEITENSSATFFCEAEGLPTPDMSWYHLSSKGDMQLLTSTNNTTLQHQLSFAKCTDTGTYMCVANNYMFALNNKSRELNVTCSPRLQTNCSSKQLIAVKSNITVSLQACFLSNPIPQVNWTIRESNIFIPVGNGINKVHQNSSITYTTFFETKLLNKKLEHYNVVAYNSFGISDVKTFTVVVEDRPFPPKNVNVTCTGTNTLYWTSNFNGGSEQVFQIIYFENNTTATEVSANIDDTGIGKLIYTVLNNLKPKTHYTFQVIASNKFNGTSSRAVYCLTAALSSDRDTNISGVIGGITGALLAIVLIAIVLIIVWKKRRNSKYKSDSESKGRKILTSRNKDDEEEDGLKDNILYVSAGGHDIVTEEGQIGAEYASVIKNKNIFKGNGGSNIQETALYAEVKKSKNDINAKVHTNGAKVKKNKEKSKAIKKEFCEDVYENMSGEDGNVASGFQENKSRNKDGLVYADLIFNPSTNGPMFVHGVDDRTIYADVDTTQKIDPLPESDEEDTDGKNIKRE